MQPRPYPDWMRTIEATRMANYRRLVEELKGGREKITGPEIATALGISAVYAWQLENGKRDTIDSKAARKMERKADKPEGWMDTDFDLWPFPDKSLLARVEALTEEQRVEVQGAIRQALSAFGHSGSESGKSAASQNAAPSRRAG